MNKEKIYVESEKCLYYNASVFYIYTWPSNLVQAVSQESSTSYIILNDGINYNVRDPFYDF